MKQAEHPGIILSKLLKERKISKRELAKKINEYPQLLGDVTLCKRKMNPSLSIRIGRELGIDEEMLMIAQTRYDIVIERKRLAKGMKINKFEKSYGSAK